MKKTFYSLLKDKNLIFYPAVTQYSNLGDIVIGRTLLSELRSHGHLIIIDRDVSDTVLKRMNIDNFERLSHFTSLPILIFIVIIALYRLFNPSLKTFYVVTPGHRFSPPNTFLGMVFELCVRLNESFRLAALRLFKVRICQLGLSIGPLSRIGGWFERLRRHFMYFYSVRESASAKFLGTIGIENVDFFPDFGWLSIEGEKSDVRSPKKEVIFSFRESTHSCSERAGYEDSLYEVLDPIVRHLTEKGFSILVTFQVALDEPIAQRIYQRYRSNSAVKYHPKQIDEDTLALYSNAAFIVSNRLHAMIFGAKRGAVPVPLVNTDDHLKIVGIFKDLGLEYLMLNLQAGPTEANKIQYALEHPEQIAKHIANYVEEQRIVADQTLNEIFA